jgi:intermediate cleaving peptidase 55
MLYLTGLDEPDTCLVLEKGQESIKTMLFVQPGDPETERWDGPRTGLDAAKSVYGADESLPISQLPRYINNAIKTFKTIYTDLGLRNPPANSLDETFIQTEGQSSVHPTTDSSITAFIKNARVAWTGEPAIKSLGSILDVLRLRKSEHELTLMRASGQIAGRAFQDVHFITQAMKSTRPGLNEHQLHATLDYGMRMRGAKCMSYVPVVAGLFLIRRTKRTDSALCPEQACSQVIILM